MENLSDIELVNNIKEKKYTEESLQELIDRHSGIYLNIVNSFLGNCGNQSLKEDIINDRALAIYNSALKYDIDRGTKFSTFLGNEAKWICLNNSTKNKKYVEINDNTFNIDKLKCQSEFLSLEFEEEVLNAFKQEVQKHPDNRIQKIFSMRYSGTRKLTPWRKISKEMGLSIQGCINIHNAALKQISKNIRSKYEVIS